MRFVNRNAIHKTKPPNTVERHVKIELRTHLRACQNEVGTFDEE
jgi:hypothetical protein